MMLMMGIGGLMVTAQLGSVADTLGIAKAVFTLAIFVNSLANGAGRIFWGWVSDNVGRERTMIIAFLIQALAAIPAALVRRPPPGPSPRVPAVYRQQMDPWGGGGWTT